MWTDVDGHVSIQCLSVCLSEKGRGQEEVVVQARRDCDGVGVGGEGGTDPMNTVALCPIRCLAASARFFPPFTMMKSYMEYLWYDQPAASKRE